MIRRHKPHVIDLQSWYPGANEYEDHIGFASSGDTKNNKQLYIVVVLNIDTGASEHFFRVNHNGNTMIETPEFYKAIEAYNGIEA